MLELHTEWLQAVREILAESIPDAVVLAYGSRVRGTCSEKSDLYLVACNPLDLGEPLHGVSTAIDAFAASPLPIDVDVRDWAVIPECFRKEILRGGTCEVQALRKT